MLGQLGFRGGGLVFGDLGGRDTLAHGDLPSCAHVTMDAAAPFPSRGDEYISHVNVTLCHKQGLSRRQMVLTGTASTSRAAEVAGGRRGRPPGTSRRELELIALRLFTEQGFDNTTIEQIAAEAGVSKRTFFRYFSSKTSVLWSEFDHEVDVIRAALDEVPAGTPMM